MTTAQFSNEAQRVRDPRGVGFVSTAYFRDLEMFPFNFVQSGAGNAGSTATLVYLQRGRYRIYPQLSRLYFSAFGAARTLAIGLSSYIAEDGSTVAAAASRFDATLDVSAASAANGVFMGAALAAADTAGIDVLVGGVTNLDNLSIIATVAGGTIPDAAVLRGFMAITRIP